MNEQHSALVSFIIAAYNERAFVVECVKSCLSQTYYNIEVVITDDGSTDGTHDLLVDHFLRDSRVRLCRFSRNRGKNAALNESYRLCAGDYVAIIGADDVNYLNRVEKQIHQIGGAGFVCGNLSFITETGESIDLWSDRYAGVTKANFDFEQLLLKPNVYGGTIFLRRELAEKIFPLPEDVAHEDRWLPLMAAYFDTVRFFNTRVIKYRIHRENEIHVTRNCEASAYEWLKFQTRELSYFRNVRNFLHNEGKREFDDFLTEQIGMLEVMTNNHLLRGFLVKQYEVSSRRGRYVQLLERWLVLRDQEKRVGDMLRQRGLQRVAIYGCGTLGNLLLQDLRRCSVVVAGFIDDKVFGGRGDQLPVVTSSQAANLGIVDAVIITPVADCLEIAAKVTRILGKIECICLDRLI